MVKCVNHTSLACMQAPTSTPSCRFLRKHLDGRKGSCVDVQMREPHKSCVHAGTDINPIVPALENIWSDSKGQSMASFNFRTVTSRFNELVYQYPIRIPERYSLVIRSLLTQVCVCVCVKVQCVWCVCVIRIPERYSLSSARCSHRCVWMCSVCVCVCVWMWMCSVCVCVDVQCVCVCVCVCVCEVAVCVCVVCVSFVSQGVSLTSSARCSHRCVSALRVYVCVCVCGRVWCVCLCACACVCVHVCVVCLCVCLLTSATFASQSGISSVSVCASLLLCCYECGRRSCSSVKSVCVGE